MTTVLREDVSTLNETMPKPLFDFGDPFKDDMLAPTNSLLQGATARTSTEAGRTATVKAGEDIRPALESLKSAGGGTLILLEGVHKPTYNIIGTANISIIGVGKNLTIIDFQNGAYNISYTGTSTTAIESFTLANFTLKNSNATAGIDIQYCDFWKIEDLRITTCDQNGVRIRGCYQSIITNVRSDSNGDNGISFSNASTTRENKYLTILNCLFDSNGLYGVRDESSSSSYSLQDTSFINNAANSNSSSGFRISSFSTKVFFLSCRADSNTSSGFNISSSKSTVTGCSAFSNGAQGFDISGDSYNSVIACIADLNTASDYDIRAEETIFIGNITLATAVPINELSVGQRKVISQGHLRNDTRSNRDLRFMTNLSGATVNAGEVVVINTATNAPNAFRTTTTVGDDFVFGVVQETTIANDATGYLVIEGWVTNLKVNGATPIAVGDFLCTYSVAGIAAKAAAGDMAFAIAYEAYSTADSNGVIDALIISPRKL